VLEKLLQPNDTVERCGLVLKDGSVVELNNLAAEPGHSFEMDHEAALPYFKRDEVAMTWHTHPDSDPNLSGEDYSSFLSWPDLVHAIIGVRDGKTVVEKFQIENGLVLVCS
jgi:proteasome lid subunit RPN8/RPN11